MLRFTVLVIALFSGICCFGQTSEKYKSCTNMAKTQFEMNKCASEEAARADADLNAV